MIRGALPLIIAWALGCPSAPEVLYELPAGYRGVFVVAVDPKAVGIPFSSGVYHVRVPPTGLVLVDDDAPLDRWHESKATFSDGTVVDVALGQPVAPYDGETVMLYLLATTPGPRHHYFVGTEADLAALPATNVAALPLGGLPTDP